MILRWRLRASCMSSQYSLVCRNSELHVYLHSICFLKTQNLTDFCSHKGKVETKFLFNFCIIQEEDKQKTGFQDMQKI